MRKLFIFSLLLIAISGINAQNRKLRANLLDKNNHSVMVVSHRGDWRNAPENSLQAIQNCIDMGVDMVEVDLKKTKDGHLIVMHDQTIDRTTTGKGKPENYTLEELRRFRLKNGAAHKTTHLIPTLEEVMLLCKGKILVNIDKGYDYFKEAYCILEKTGTVDQCVIKAGLPYEQVKVENGEVLDKVIFMPVINLNKEDAERIKKMIYGGYIKEYDDVVDISRMFLADYFKGINSFDYLDEIEGINVEYLNQMLNNVFKEEKMVISIVKN